MSLSNNDRVLLQRCIDGEPGAWQDFVYRFVGLVVHVANHTAAAKGRDLDDATRDDLVAEVFLTLLASDKVILRRFRRNSSLVTYLTVIARRVIARRLSQTGPGGNLSVTGSEPADEHADQDQLQMENAEEVERLMSRLDPEEADVVRMYHLEGKSYQEISRVVGLSENSIGPLLSRARQKMREGA
ncbi:sigma-70 family RNA polymerase sigma factor [Roseiconus nitratireducens]|uniref:Sigma-70 family RNA polymerase sigma factor n=1 Tax=Roseiconus nitratireducens TaxID=2605748 RepID=A0A5M6D4C5_9BACT|nr:sigma-70 family RNA polymerase sigma factor [Roseiconus nitratireducens]KAA5541440.1 sigma-70 family RNA polymerase sigma factor [Roseiconus nitratireducens]